MGFGIRAVVTGMVLLFLILTGVFSWRVVHFTRLIQRGDLQDLPSFEDRMTQIRSDDPIPEGTFASVATTDDPAMGQKNAPLTIVEFADFECPFSREVSYLLRSLALASGDQIRYVYRDFPLEELHPQATAAAQAASCAGEQGKFWEYHDKLFQNQGAFSSERFVELARELNLREAAFESCVRSNRYTQEIEQDLVDGRAAGVVGTPTFFFNGHRIAGAIPGDILRALVERFVSKEL